MQVLAYLKSATADFAVSAVDQIVHVTGNMGMVRMHFHITSYNKVTVIGTAASRVYFHLKAEAVRMGE